MPFSDFANSAGLADAWRAQPAVARGVLCMCLSGMAFACMHVMVRHVSAELPPVEIAFFRNVFGFCAFLPVLLSNGVRFMATQRIGLHMLRAVLNIGAMLLFFTALSQTPLAKVTALSFSAPIFAAVLSVLVLGERFRLRRWTAILLGFLGTLIVLRPGLVAVDAGSLMVVSSAILWASAIMVIKVLSRTDSSLAITAWMTVFLSLLSFVPAMWVWQTPSSHAWVWLVLIGVAGTVAQVLLSQALKEAEPTAVLPFDFLKLIWVTLLAAWFFGEIPDLYTWIGAAVIFSSGLYIANRERRDRNAPPPPAAPGDLA